MLVKKRSKTPANVLSVGVQVTYGLEYWIHHGCLGYIVLPARHAGLLHDVLHPLSYIHHGPLSGSLVDKALNTILQALISTVDSVVHFCDASSWS